MSSPDHYRTLGVDQSADTKAIKAAFRRLAKQYHPDHNPRDPAAAVRFREIVGAYEELVDSARRAAYDLTLRRPASPSQPIPSTWSRYERHYLGSRIDRAIETFDHLVRGAWRETWRPHIHGRILLRAIDEVCEFEGRLLKFAHFETSSDADRRLMSSSLHRLHAALRRWKEHELFVHADKLMDEGDIAGRSPLMLLRNPDAAAVESRLNARNAAFEKFANMPDGDRYVSPDSSSRGMFSLGPNTLGILTPGVIRLKGIQNELDILLMCAAFAKKHWMGRWVLNAADNPEHLLRAAIAAEIIGVETLGYKIPIDRRQEADWVKHRTGKRHRVHWLSASGLAEKRCDRTTSSLHYVLDRPSDVIFVKRFSVLYSQDLAGRMAGLQRIFFERPRGYRRVCFGMDFDA